MKRLPPRILLLLSIMVFAGCDTVDDLRRSISEVGDSLIGVASNRNVHPPLEPNADVARSSTIIDAKKTPSRPPISISGAVPHQAVIDGDSLVLQNMRVRLHGIDALEAEQSCGLRGQDVPCGQVAHNALVGFVAGTEVTCERKAIDGYGRLVSQCFAGGFDLAAAMVRTGLALADRRYSQDYIGEEERAKSLKRGMWGGSFVEPWKWRARGSR